MPEDATTQGADDTTDQDVLGLDIEPVTESSPEQGGQAKTAPTDDTGEEKGAAKPTNADAKEKRVTDKKNKITQKEWQDTQDEIAQLRKEQMQDRLEKDQAKYEARNPVVLSERNATKWEELCKQKADSEHKYHRLDFDDLKIILLGLDQDTLAVNEEAMEELEQAEKKPISPPAFRSSSARKDLPGGVTEETYSWLKSKGYSDEQIKNSGDISLTGSIR